MTVQVAEKNPRGRGESRLLAEAIEETEPSSCVAREAAQPTGNWKGAAASELPGVNKALRMPGFRCCVAGRLNGGST